MATPNLHWPVYKDLEKDFMKLADYIHFSDDQFGTYSMYITDLIVRCAIEIEALLKELYCAFGGNFIVKYDDKSFKEMQESYCIDNKITVVRFSKSQEIKNWGKLF